MKRLFLIRHAKSDWSEPGQSDFDRKLNPRGLRDAPFMAAMLAERMKKVDLIISSPANRAITTARFFAKSLQVSDKEFFTDERIYEATPAQLLLIVNAIDDHVNTAILFGHNPGFSQLSTYLTEALVEMPTCAIAEIEFDLESWKLISGSSGNLVQFDYPKKFK